MNIIKEKALKREEIHNEEKISNFRNDLYNDA